MIEQIILFCQLTHKIFMIPIDRQIRNLAVGVEPENKNMFAVEAIAFRSEPGKFFFLFAKDHYLARYGISSLVILLAFHRVIKIGKGIHQGGPDGLADLMKFAGIVGAEGNKRNGSVGRTQTQHAVHIHILVCGKEFNTSSFFGEHVHMLLLVNRWVHNERVLMMDYVFNNEEGLFFLWIIGMLLHFFDLPQVPVHMPENGDVTLVNIAATTPHKINTQVLCCAGDITDGLVSHF